MHDYTTNGLVVSQMDMANSYLYLIDKKLKKLNRSLRVIAIVGVATMVFKHKDKIKELINLKGV
jgi:hypothetical protein